MKKKLVWFALILIILSIVGLVMSKSVSTSGDHGTRFITAPVKSGSLVATISATGTIEPEDLIDVGAQVAGRIVSFGKDEEGRPIDYGSHVKAGAVLARIDSTVYQSNVDAAEATVAGGKADLESAKANLLSLKAKLDQAQRDWDRARKLGPSEALAQSAYDSYQSALEIAKANLQVGEVAIQQAQATLQEDQANLDRAKRDLSYCTIQSPVNGVIIDRRVNIGQTVVASLSAPSLFLIAKDLTKVQIWVAVNEADIGHIHPGQKATFTVDAFPNETFHGVVDKIRLNASMTQNVVTYTVVVDTDNSNGRLLPYLTANVQFETARHDNVLTIPDEALQWSPPASLDASLVENASTGAGARRGGYGFRGNRNGAPADTEKGTLWVLAAGKIHPVKVDIGMSANGDTEVKGKAVREGMQVVTGLETNVSRSASSNPFIPQFHRGNRNNNGNGRGNGGGRRPS